MKSKTTVSNRIKTASKLKLAVGWFGILTPVFGAGVLVGVGIMGGITTMFVGQVAVVSVINYFVGRVLQRPVVVKRGAKSRI